MSRARRVAAFATILCLSACSLTPAFHADGPPPPVAWREASPPPISAPVADAWWQGFGSAELNDLVQRADAQNFDIAAAVARVREANAQVRINGAALLPSLDATAQVGRTKETVPDRNKYNDFQLGAQASYELDFWGRNATTVNAAKETAIATAYDREVVQITTEASVANTFFQLVESRARFLVAQQNLATAQALLKAFQREYQVGTANLLDVTQQETVVASASAALPPLLQQQSQSLDALAILIGSQPEQLTLATVSLDKFALPAIAPGLPSELLRRRPDVRESEAQLLAANYDIGNARAQFFPDISLTASGGVESKQLANLFTPQGLMYQLIASLTQPIFEGGKLKGQLDYARARYQEQLADYQKSVVSAFSDVEDNLAAVSRTQQAFAQQQLALSKAQTALKMVQQQFKAGTVNTLQVLQVETSLFTQQDAYVTARLAELQALVGLAKALGGGWSDRDRPPTPDGFDPDLNQGKTS